MGSVFQGGGSGSECQAVLHSGLGEGGLQSYRQLGCKHPQERWDHLTVASRAQISRAIFLSLCRVHPSVSGLDWPDSGRSVTNGP